MHPGNNGIDCAIAGRPLERGTNLWSCLIIDLALGYVLDFL